jgi:hypothetical protein
MFYCGHSILGAGALAKRCVVFHPAFVNPQPFAWEFADLVLDKPGQSCGQKIDIPVVIAGIRRFDCGMHLHVKSGAPHSPVGDRKDGSPEFQGQQGGRGRGECLPAEKRNANAFTGALVHEQQGRLTFAQ